MADTRWDKEMSKIDRQLESISDEALFPTKGETEPAVRAANVEKQRRTSTFGVVARLTLATALAVGVAIWPYDHGCGLKLLYYLFALAVVTGAGVWSAIWSWRHHSGRAHVLSLALVAYGLILGAGEILPRVGYATPTLERPAVWGCE
jgi:cytochrome bd-type quinol oxidase subunit 2